MITGMIQVHLHFPRRMITSLETHVLVNDDLGYRNYTTETWFALTANNIEHL